jgi:hypothetical protein
MHPTIQKPAYATPINKWHHPRKVQKAKPTAAKKLNDKNEKSVNINKQLTNFQSNDDSEHPKPDATAQK